MISRWFGLFVLPFLVMAVSAHALTVSDAVPPDPVLLLEYQRAQVAFELAPRSIIDACTLPTFAVAWILAEADRPEGRYVLLAGPTWDDNEDGYGTPGKHVLESFGDGGISLITPSGACVGKWDPDNAFGNFFPENPDNRPTAYDEQLMRDMGIDMIRRAERALGGRKGFLKALAATGFRADQEDAVMIPLLKLVRDGKQG